MDGKRFDAWTRYVGMANSRREALGVLAGGLLASLGVAGVSAKNRKTRGHGNARSQGKDRKHRDQRTGEKRRQEGREDANDLDGTARKNKKKNPCASAGGSCKKRKKGKTRKCCAGLRCDRQTRRCLASGGAACPNESTACQEGCVPQDTPCCPAGSRACDGACASGTEACALEFAHCMAPFAADWVDAVDACANACEGSESAACRACLEGVLEAFAEPLVRCFRVTCTDAAAGGSAERSDLHAAAAAKTCDRDNLRICRLNALISGSGQTSYATLLGMLEGPIGAVGALLLGAGLTNADLEACEQQFGCPNGECDPDHGVCCDTWNCKYYDPGSRTCSRTCNKDQQCDFVTRTCVTRCKQCYDYLVDGRHMPCGKITNNCGEILTCNGCATNETCVDRRCKLKICPRRGKRGRAAGDDCCLLKTCAEMGKACGTHDDGCGGTVDCGSCNHIGPRAVCLAFEGKCSCSPDDFCHGCGLQDDGCGHTFDCGGCATIYEPNAFCGEDRQCHCTPDTCASIGKTCGRWLDGCGDVMSCGPQNLLCGAEQQICCAEGQTCCGLDWSDSACCSWSACHKWPGGKPKGCCPAIQQCVDQGGKKICCREGWRCRGAGDQSYPGETCCVLPGSGDAALHIDAKLCCSGKLASMYPHICA